MLPKNNADAYAEHKLTEREKKRYAKIKKYYSAVTTNSFLQVPLRPVSTLLSLPSY